MFTIKLSDSAKDMLTRYALEAHKTPEEIAGDIVTTAMLHFSAGICSGLDHAAKQIRSSK